jgi:hypothetical protein
VQKLYLIVVLLTGIISANGQAKIAAATTENFLFTDDTESGAYTGQNYYD